MYNYPRMSSPTRKIESLATNTRRKNGKKVCASNQVSKFLTAHQTHRRAWAQTKNEYLWVDSRKFPYFFFFHLAQTTSISINVISNLIKLREVKA